MPLTRRRIAGVVLALALAGALSAGVASGVERVRGRARKRPEPPPPFSQRDKARMPAEAESRDSQPPRPVTHSFAAGSAPDTSDSARNALGRPRMEADVRLASASSGGVAAEALRTEVGSQDDHSDVSLSGLTARIPAPMRVGWTMVEPSAGSVRLVAEVERRTGFGAPVSVRLSLPHGATLLEGPEDFTVPEGSGGDVRTVAYVVTFSTGVLPAEDLVLVAHAEGASFGAHAEERYSFGRAPAAAPHPVPEGPVLPPSLMGGGDESQP